MASRRMFEWRGRGRTLALWGVAAAIVGAFAVGRAVAQETPTKVSVKGRLAGTDDLLNPVWNEDKETKAHRYTFRQPSETVGKNAKKLTAYAPKEVAIVALGEGEAEKGTPFQVHVSGGRTTPVTIVVAPGRNVQFINDDPFSHKLFSVQKDPGSLGPEETKPAGNRTWQPPKEGVYEIRDALFPSVRSWIVVEPKAQGVAYPNAKNEFVVPNLPPGNYDFRAYFCGAPVGEALTFEVTAGRDVQELPKPLAAAKGKGGDKDADKDADKDGKDGDKDGDKEKKEN